MDSMLVFFLVFVVVFTALGYFSLRWANRHMKRFIEGRLRAIETIVNYRQVPEQWLTRHRRRATRLAGSGASDGVIRRLSGIARKRCLANIQELIRLVDAQGLSDSASTKQLMLTALKEEKARWEDPAIWDELVDLTAPPPDPLELSDPDEDEDG
jgi:hypothetical protein